MDYIDYVFRITNVTLFTPDTHEKASTNRKLG